MERALSVRACGAHRQASEACAGQAVSSEAPCNRGARGERELHGSHLVAAQQFREHEKRQRIHVERQRAFGAELAMRIDGASAGTSTVEGRSRPTLGYESEYERMGLGTFPSSPTPSLETGLMTAEP
jgi:hypothetical protein